MRNYKAFHLVKSLLKSKLLVKKQFEKFKAVEGMSRSTFFRYRKILRLRVAKNKGLCCFCLRVVRRKYQLKNKEFVCLCGDCYKKLGLMGFLECL